MVQKGIENFCHSLPVGQWSWWRPGGFVFLLSQAGCSPLKNNWKKHMHPQNMKRGKAWGKFLLGEKRRTEGNWLHRKCLINSADFPLPLELEQILFCGIRIANLRKQNARPHTTHRSYISVCAFGETQMKLPHPTCTIHSKGLISSEEKSVLAHVGYFSLFSVQVLRIFCDHQGCLRPNPHRTRDATRNTTQANGTCWCEWGYPHCKQTTSKEKCSNLPARLVPRPVWIGPYVSPGLLLHTSGSDTQMCVTCEAQCG